MSICPAPYYHDSFQTWHVLRSNHTVLPAISHTCIHNWIKSHLSLLPAAQYHHRLASAHSRPTEDRRLSWPRWLAKMPRWAVWPAQRVTWFIENNSLHQSQSFHGTTSARENRNACRSSAGYFFYLGRVRGRGIQNIPHIFHCDSIS